MLTQPSSSDGKDAKGTNKGAYIGAASIGSTYTKGACIWDTCSVEGIYTHVRSACIANPCARDAWIRYAYIGSIFATYTCIKGVSTKETCIESANSTCSRGAYTETSCAGGAGGVSAVKGLEIHLQLSWILKLRQYSTILETGIRVS